jgi:bifunctional DNA-binding transcriptional regulator/antitoxin component of YhaV-PrlF toxin-antitoxin module
MVRVVVNNGQYKIAIPKDLAESKGWGKGTKLLIIEDDKGNVIIKEISREDSYRKNR